MKLDILKSPSLKTLFIDVKSGTFGTLGYWTYTMLDIKMLTTFFISSPLHSIMYYIVINCNGYENNFSNEKFEKIYEDYFSNEKMWSLLLHILDCY